MKIPYSDWKRYVDRLGRINKTAAVTMQYWMEKNPGADAEQLVEIAHAVAEKYGEAAASLACEMYDAIAAAQKANVKPAEPAEPASYGETAKAVYGTLKNKQNTVPATVGRLVKQTGADTMLQNAARDRAQFAWVPMGDTCAFCMMLASRGWQYQSKKAMKNGHAEHIHANCDCEYCIRFDGKSTVEGYDPDRYLEMYENAEGDTWQEKVNAMRREIDAEKREQREKDNLGSTDKRQTAVTAGEWRQSAEARPFVNQAEEIVKRAHYEYGEGLVASGEVSGGHLVRYEDITEQWYPDATPGSHEVKDLMEYTAPDGKVYHVHEKDVVLDYKPHEKEIAELLKREVGGEIFMVPRVNNPQGVRTPDYIFNGKRYDLKTLEPKKKENAFFQRVRSASGQAPNVIVDITMASLDDEAVERQINKVFWSQDTAFVKEIVIVKNNKIVKVLARK